MNYQASLVKAIARILILLLLALAIPVHLNAAGPAPLNLLSNTNFVVLAETQITTTGGGSVNGDVGLSPAAGASILLTCAQVTGTIYVASPGGSTLACQVVNSGLMTQSVNDMLTSYADAAGRTPVPTGPNLNPGAAFSTGYDIGGMTLAPGLYKFGNGETAFINSDVTLSGSPSDVWIFQCGADLEVANAVHIILAGGANANNIFWQVTSKAVLGTTAVFNGTILAGTSITMNTGSTINGRALAQAQVTFNGTGAVLPVTAPAIAVQQPAGTNLVNGVTNNFGSVATGANTSHTFAVTNNGSANLTISGLTIDGTNAASFSVTNLTATVIPGGSTNFTVNFAPVSAGMKSAVLHIANNDNNNNPFNISLAGNGTGGAAPAITIQQPFGANLTNNIGTNNYGLVSIGTNASLTFTVTNTGTTNLTGLGITINGTDAALFTVTTNPVAPLVPGSNTTFTVRFTPVSTGVKSAVLHIASNDTNNSPFNIALAGTGTNGVIVVSTNLVAIATSPTALNGQTGLFEQTVRVTNSSPGSVAGIRLYILTLPVDVQVYNASGSTNGVPYLQYNHPIASAGTLDFVIEYYRASRLAIPLPVFIAQEIIPVSLTVTGVVLSVPGVTNISGRFLLEFTAIPGNTYAVQYSSNLVNWLTAVPTIIAPANRVQWYDDGPPKTVSIPSSVGSRFYQVIELP